MNPVIIMARETHPELIKRVKSLIKSGLSTYLVVDKQPEPVPRFNHRIIWIPDSTLEKYHWGTLVSEGFRRKNNIKFSSWDRATFWAYTQKFEKAWFIEDDVNWTSNSILKFLIKSYSNNNAGLIASYIPGYTPQNIDNWNHWNTLYGYFPKKLWRASFNVISRISYKTLQGLYNFASKHHKLIFHETLLPTITNITGQTIEYINNPFTLIKWRPVFNETNIKPYIYNGFRIFHPVKDYELINKLSV